MKVGVGKRNLRCAEKLFRSELTKSRAELMDGHPADRPALRGRSIRRSRSAPWMNQTVYASVNPDFRIGTVDSGGLSLT